MPSAPTAPPAPSNDDRSRRPSVPGAFVQRARAFARWGGSILSILFLAGWAVSAWRTGIWWLNVGLGVGLSNGRLFLGCGPSEKPGGYFGRNWSYAHPAELEWSFELMKDREAWGVAVPFWVLTVATIALAALGGYRSRAARRRALHNHCPACGYDRAGLSTPDAVCPECGAAAPTVAPHPTKSPA